MRSAATPEPEVWTADAVRQLGMTTDVETAAAILGIGCTKAYELAKSGAFPVRVLRIGRRYVVPVPALMALLPGMTRSDRPLVGYGLGDPVVECGELWRLASVWLSA